MSDCPATLDAYDQTHLCRHDATHDGAHVCDCGIGWTTA